MNTQRPQKAPRAPGGETKSMAEISRDFANNGSFPDNLVSAHVQTEFCGEILVFSERLGLFTVGLALYWKAVILEWMGAFALVG
jgi:hypothetical protein